MIELIIMIAVVKMFTKKAQEKNLSKGLWGFIGAASYYIPVLIVGFWLLPELVENGTIELKSESDAMIKGVLYSVAAGAFFCILAYQVLRRQPDADDENLIDQES